jgi:hypothetical protein
MYHIQMCEHSDIDRVETEAKSSSQEHVIQLNKTMDPHHVEWEHSVNIVSC